MAARLRDLRCISQVLFTDLYTDLIPTLEANYSRFYYVRIVNIPCCKITNRIPILSSIRLCFIYIDETSAS